MQAHTETVRPADGWHVFLPGASAAVTRAFWHPRRREGGGFIVFGGCLFWLLLWYVVLLWYGVKAVIYAAVIAALVIAQGFVLVVDGCEAAWLWAFRSRKER